LAASPNCNNNQPQQVTPGAALAVKPEMNNALTIGSAGTSTGQFQSTPTARAALSTGATVTWPGGPN